VLLDVFFFCLLQEGSGNEVICTGADSLVLTSSDPAQGRVFVCEANCLVDGVHLLVDLVFCFFPLVKTINQYSLRFWAVRENASNHAIVIQWENNMGSFVF